MPEILQQILGYTVTIGFILIILMAFALIAKDFFEDIMR